MKFFKYDNKRKTFDIVIEHIAVMIACYTVIIASFIISPESLDRHTGLAKAVPPCMFKKITGIPCPTCGMTHAFTCISRGRLNDALNYNILSFPLYAFFLGLGTVSALSLAVFIIKKVKGKIKTDF